MKHTPIPSRMISGAARPAPTSQLAAPQNIYATARAQIEQELGPRPMWSADDEAKNFIQDMAVQWQEFGLAGCVQQASAERWLAKMEVLNQARRWDRAVSDRCKLLGMAPTLIGDA